MEWVKNVHWIALFIAFLGPVVSLGLAFEWLVNLMLFLGIVVALTTYNSGASQNALLYLLLVTLVFLTLPSSTSYPLMEYLRGVATLGAWYVMPIALAQGWKALLG